MKTPGELLVELIYKAQSVFVDTRNWKGITEKGIKNVELFLKAMIKLSEEDIAQIHISGDKKVRERIHDRIQYVLCLRKSFDLNLESLCNCEWLSDCLESSENGVINPQVKQTQPENTFRN